MTGFFTTYTLFIPLAAFIVATVLKGVFLKLKGRFSISGALGTGGMPSGHTSIVTSLTTAIGLIHGIHSDIFSVCLLFSTIVIYDAMNLRFAVGLHAKTLNILREDMEKLNESVGHLPKEVLAGSIVGMTVAYILVQI